MTGCPPNLPITERTVVLRKSIGVQLPGRQEMETWKWVATGTGLFSKAWNEATSLHIVEFKRLRNTLGVHYSVFSLAHIPFRLAAPRSWVLSFHWIAASWTMAFCLKGIGLSEKPYLFKFLNNKSLAACDSHCFAIDFRQRSMTHWGKDRSSLSGTPCQKPASPLVTVGVPL